ncbi:MAG TPA: hypothetical protein VFG73_01310 [Rhodanobacteraceae bacterium]|nr:hypothetical protein [Rhodanobacteraceae bacterium]
MYFQKWLAGAALGLALVSVAQAQAPNAQVVRRAESLSQQQIQASQNVAGLQALAGIYHATGDKQRYRWALDRLTTLRPGSLRLKLALAASYAGDDMKTPAYDLLLRIKGQGFGVDIGDDPRFEKIHGTQVWDYIVANLKESLKPFGEGKPAFTLKRKGLLIEAIGYDPARKQFLFGSAHDGHVYLGDKNGNLHDFIAPDASNKLWAVMDLVADAKRNRLWVATTSVPQFEGYSADNAGKAALDEFNLKTGKLLHRYELPGRKVFLSSLALAPNGDIYAADGVNRVIYTIEKGKLKELVGNRHLSSIRAMTVGPGGKVLYLADPQIGVLGFDLKTHKAFGLGYNPEALVLPGIVDMLAYDGTLVVVEPGMQPARVMRLTLSDDGRRVTKAMPLDVAQPAFENLGAATAVGDTMYFIANNQQGKYDQHGLVRDDATLEPLTIFASNLRYAWGESGINMGMHALPTAKPGAKGAAAGKRQMVKPLQGPGWMKHGFQADRPAAASSGGK